MEGSGLRRGHANAVLSSGALCRPEEECRLGRVDPFPLSGDPLPARLSMPATKAMTETAPCRPAPDGPVAPPARPSDRARTSSLPMARCAFDRASLDRTSEIDEST